MEIVGIRMNKMNGFEDAMYGVASQFIILSSYNATNQKQILE
jgi:hypothetical protein